MNDIDKRIREQIKHMRTKGIEPDTVYMCYELWDSMNRPRMFAGVYVSPSDRLLGKFEVR